MECGGAHCAATARLRIKAGYVRTDITLSYLPRVVRVWEGESWANVSWHAVEHFNHGIFLDASFGFGCMPFRLLPASTFECTHNARVPVIGKARSRPPRTVPCLA